MATVEKQFLQMESVVPSALGRRAKSAPLDGTIRTSREKAQWVGNKGEIQHGTLLDAGHGKNVAVSLIFRLGISRVCTGCAATMHGTTQSTPEQKCTAEVRTGDEEGKKRRLDAEHDVYSGEQLVELFAFSAHFAFNGL